MCMFLAIWEFTPSTEVHHSIADDHMHTIGMVSQAYEMSVVDSSLYMYCMLEYEMVILIKFCRKGYACTCTPNSIVSISL